MKQYHILYKLPTEDFARGKNIEAENSIQALEIFKKEQNIDNVIAVYRVSERGSIDY